MAHLVLVQHKPFCFVDFLQFEVNGSEYRVCHGTFRNKISKLRKENQVELSYQTTGTKLYCTYCSNLITATEFTGYFTHNLIAVDTSAIISRIVSKDLKSAAYFSENNILLPTFVYEELDSKQPDKKKGG